MLSKMAPSMAAMALLGVCLFCPVSVSCLSSYTREELLHFKDLIPPDIFPDLLTRSTDLLDILVKGTAFFARAVRWTRRQRGKRAGCLARLRRRGTRPPLPGIFLANVNSLPNKMDELRCLVARSRDFLSSAVFAFVETHLSPSVPDGAVELEGFTTFRADRDFRSVNKTRGGGLLFFVNDRWSSDVTVIHQHCSTAIETLFILCHPFYSPREFNSFILACVYIPPDADVTAAVDTLAEQILNVERQHPDSFVVVLGDFNKANLSRVLPKYRQQVTCTTRGLNTLDHCYCTIRQAYHSVPRAALGKSDHDLIHLIPRYRQRLKISKPVVSHYRVWSGEACERLCAWLVKAGCDQDFVEWAGPVAGNDLDGYTDTVTSFTSFCEEMCVPLRSRKSYNNDKPWFSAHLRRLRSEKEAARRSGDRDRFKESKYRFATAVKEAKHRFSEKLQRQFSEGDPSSVWKGLKKITNYKPKSPQTTDSLHLANELNAFFCRFEKESPSPPLLHPPGPQPPPLHPGRSSDPPAAPHHTPPLPPPSSPPLSVTESQVKCLFKSQNPRKAAGPDSVSPAVLKHCADQLAPVFTYIFNASLELCHVPACFKASTIIPIPKKAKVTGLNDYRPVALTSVVMKVLERLVLAHLKSITDPVLDPLQFAYRANRSTDDAVNMALHYVLEHLDSAGNYARILFVDFSSAFNTILPHILELQLSLLQVPDPTCRWITDFLTNRSQRVKLGKYTSSSRSTSTGSPQGCVLSPLLFSMYTNGCISLHRSVKLLKFADDTTLVGLISRGDESAYRREIERLQSWCSSNNLELNAQKTVEMVVDFRRSAALPLPITLGGIPVASVESCRFLGLTISRDLKWELNTIALVKKAQKRMFFLRQLKKFRLPGSMLTQFYTAIIESILTYSIITWFPAATAKDQAKLQRVIRSAERVIGCPLPSLKSLHDTRALRRARKIMAEPSHPGHGLFNPLPSGRRLRLPKALTSRHRLSFFPSAARLVNDSGPPLPLPRVIPSQD